MCYNSNEVYDRCPSDLDALELSIWIFNMLEELEETEDVESSVEEIEDNVHQNDGKNDLPAFIFLIMV